MATPTQPMALGEPKFTLDTSDVAGLLGGDESMSPNAIVYDRMKRYNSPRSYQIAKRCDGPVEKPRPFIFDRFWTDLDTLFDSYGWNGPKFRATHSGTVIEETGHLASLFTEECAAWDSEGEIVPGRKTQAINGSRPLPASTVLKTSVYDVTNPYWIPSRPLSSGPVPPTPLSKCRPGHYYHGSSHQSSPIPLLNHPCRQSLHNPGQPVSPYTVSSASSPNSSRQLLSPNPVSPISLSTPDRREWIPTPMNSDFQLPPPVTATSQKDWTRVEQGVVPPLIAWIGGLAAVSSSQPGAVLLFVCAGTVILATYFVSPPRSNEESRIVSVFLRRLHDILVAVGCSLIVLGIGLAFPKEIALIPLFAFIFFAGLAALFRMMFAPWITATLFGTALLSLVPFVVLTFMA